MTEAGLYDLEVDTGFDESSGVSMPEAVKCESFQPGGVAVLGEPFGNIGKR